VLLVRPQNINVISERLEINYLQVNL
jgi:hypothetical protein